MSFSINNRRYTGCKAKLIEWITKAIEKNCSGSTSFCDLFAGTGVVTAALIDKFNDFYINDFLFSNEIIYKAFFMKCDYSEPKLYQFYTKYSNLEIESINDNFCSLNYGNKFFSYDDSKIIGYIRDDLENSKNELNEKEYAILLASLLYSADRCSNTCGHYDSYIKKEPVRNGFKFELINPIIKSASDNRDIHISREDSNVLARNLKCDVVYIDPPYSSRQYSRFYHVLETLTKWDNPKLFGTALKPKEENMSDYCKTKAIDAFKELIYSLDCKYIVVSYNNTYNSKSKSSENKMKLEDMLEVLNNKGITNKIEKKHKAFNAGKTNLEDHKEILFITKVGEFYD